MFPKNKQTVTATAIVFLFGMLSTASFAQKAASYGPNFDVAEFKKKFETDQWLVEYDEVAWKTSDLVVTEDKREIAKLGSDWFCFQDDKLRWHAVYGKLENNKFQIVFHYTFDASAKIGHSTEKLDQGFLDANARSLAIAKSKLKTSIPANSPAFNQYIRKNSDGTFGV